MKAMIKTTMLITSVFIIVILFNLSCKKEKPNDAIIKIYLTDVPAPYESVFIDIQSVLIKADISNNEKAFTLSRKGVYDILKFSNGLDTLLGSIALPSCNIMQVRLVFGENNRLVAGQESINLDIPQYLESEIKIDFNQKIEEGKNYTLWLDIEASRSVVFHNNSYELRPVFRMFIEDSCGSVKGVIRPKESKPFIYAMSATDTFSTVANAEGYFLIRALPPGTYNIKFVPQLIGMREGILENIEVELNKINYIGTISLN